MTKDQPTAGVALKPCPFCGGERAHTFYIRDGRQAGCPDCGARSGPGFHGRADQPSAEERAIDAWNARTPASGPVEADDRLAVAVEAVRHYACSCEPGHCAVSLDGDDAPVDDQLCGRKASEALALLTKSGEAGE